MKVTTLTYKDEFIANTHIVYLTDKDVISFDCGQSSKTFINYIASHNLNLKAIFLTHGHFDHIRGLDFIDDTIPVYIALDDLELLNDPYKNCSSEFEDKVSIKRKVFTLSDEEIVTIDGINIQIFNTPFHTLGSSVYLINKEILITGDTLFKSVIGRCDLPTSKARLVDSSLKRIIEIYRQYGDMTVYPGHGDNTTLAREVEKNFYLRNIR